MSGFIDDEVCPTCGETFAIEFDPKAGYRKISQCYCDRLLGDVRDFLKEKGLWDEFVEFHRSKEEPDDPDFRRKFSRLFSL
uniref:Uncharacterized protein n=1 Tax=Archaeoglobus fulgidus TaxID=2234 RepID=A0A7C2N9G6_ARCFL